MHGHPFKVDLGSAVAQRRLDQVVVAHRHPAGEQDQIRDLQRAVDRDDRRLEVISNYRG